MAMSLPHKATFIASVTALVMAIIKVVVGAITGSMAVVASAIDSLLDMIMSLFNLFAVKNSEKEADEIFNYGRGKIEGLASLFEGSLIAVSGIFIIYQAVSNLVHHKEIVSLDIALWVMIGSTVVTLALVLFLVAVARKTDSLVIKSDVLHYQSDLYVNVGIIVSLALIFFTDWHWIDSVVSIFIALYIIVSAYRIAKEGVLMLMDRALDEHLTDGIKAIVEAHPKVNSYHYLRTRKSANMNIVDVHLVFDEKMLLKEAHAVSDEVEDQIRALDVEAKWIITAHMDPKDDSHIERQFL